MLRINTAKTINSLCQNHPLLQVSLTESGFVEKLIDAAKSEKVLIEPEFVYFYYFEVIN